MDASVKAIEFKEVSKRYDATIALDAMSFEVAQGQVHALLGENGAGKSTTVKILSGLVRADSGDVSVFGERVALRNARDAHALGVQTAFQEMTLVPDLTVTQNMLLPYEPTGWGGQIRARRSHELVQKTLDELNITGIDPRLSARHLDLPARQKIEIAKAASRNPKILLLDEPTSSLSSDDVDWLSGLVEHFRSIGVTIIFITHRMREVRMFCDRLSILRNGRHVGTRNTAEITDSEVIELMIGRSLSSAFPPKARPVSGVAPTPVLAGSALSVGSRLTNVSFALRPGEILGVAGLQGMGQLELFLGLFGVSPFSSGTVSIDGRPVILASPEDAVQARIGISLVPEDRKTEGLCLKLSGKHNASLPVIGRFAKFGIIDRDAEALAVDRVLERLQVHPRALYVQCASFSGGNQQKIAIGKWLLAESRIMLLYDPTRGVDVGTKHDIYLLVREFAQSGGAVLFYSTEIPELVNLCDRVCLLYRGALVDELDYDEITELAIMRGALGESRAARAIDQQALAS